MGNETTHDEVEKAKTFLEMVEATTIDKITGIVCHAGSLKEEMDWDWEHTGEMVSEQIYSNRSDLDNSVSKVDLYLMSVIQVRVMEKNRRYDLACWNCEEEHENDGNLVGAHKEAYCSIDCLNESYSR